jgi:hypothetical protein
MHMCCVLKVHALRRIGGHELSCVQTCRVSAILQALFTLASELSDASQR